MLDSQPASRLPSSVHASLVSGPANQPLKSCLKKTTATPSAIPSAAATPSKKSVSIDTELNTTQTFKPYMATVTHSFSRWYRSHLKKACLSLDSKLDSAEARCTAWKKAVREKREAAREFVSCKVDRTKYKAKYLW